MAYGYAQPTGDYRQNGILSLLEKMASPKGGAVSDKEMTYFMDKDTGTEFDPLKRPTRNPGRHYPLCRANHCGNIIRS